jgi:hypothetical protein
MPHIEHRLTLLTAALRELWALQQERLEEEKRQILANQIATNLPPHRQDLNSASTLPAQ